MEIDAPSASGLEVSPPKWAGETRYVARQPILDVRGRVHGYELLFRDDPAAAGSLDVDMAARTMLDNAVMFGLDWLTNGSPAFVSCTAEALTEQLVLVLEPHMTVLAVPASLELTPRLMEACRSLKAHGFRLALDDFEWKADLLPLVRLVDYIRVDFTHLSIAQQQYLRQLNSASIEMIAKKVETQEEYRQACDEGFTLFQGDYFCHPVLLKKRKVPANWMLHFEIVRQLYRDPIDVRQVGQLVLRDASITYRLLRLVNSPVYSPYQEVRSIEAAIITVGEDTLRRMVSVAVLSELNSKQPPEILHMALLRARFCEQAADLCRLDPQEQYLLGMLSLLPAMLCLPMEELTPTLPLRRQICEALEGAMNPERSLLGWLEFHERGDWAACDLVAQANGLRQEKLMQCYAEGAVWAEASLIS